MRIEAVLVGAIALTLVAPPVHADPQDSLRACLDAAKAMNLPAIQDKCSEAVDSGALSARDTAIALNARGLGFLGQRKFAQAIADLSEAIRLQPQAATLYGNRAGAYVGNKQYALAVADGSSAIALQPDHALYYSNRGTAYIALGKYDAAIKDLDRAINLKPDYPQAYANRGSARQLKGDPEGAISDLNTAISLSPTYGLAYTRRAEAYLDKGDNAKSEADCRKAFELHRQGNDDLGYDLPGHSFHCTENGPVRG